MYFSDLATKGYVVVRSFLNENDIQMLIDDFNRVGLPTDLTHGQPYGKVSYACQLVMYKTLLKAISQIREEKILDIDFFMPGGGYISTKNVSYEWHQDHESYYIFQQTLNHLNFWIPIIKPDPKLTGLRIVPYDILEKVAPDYVNAIRGRGALIYNPDPVTNTTQVIDQEDDLTWVLPIDIDSIAIAPELNPGDLLLLRGDIIHRTQDSLTDRTAVSFRAVSGSLVISKDKMFHSGCSHKKNLMLKNREYYAWILQQFNLLGKDKITALDLYADTINHPVLPNLTDQGN